MSLQVVALSLSFCTMMYTRLCRSGSARVQHIAATKTDRARERERERESERAFVRLLDCEQRRRHFTFFPPLFCGSPLPLPLLFAACSRSLW